MEYLQQNLEFLGDHLDECVCAIRTCIPLWRALDMCVFQCRYGEDEYVLIDCPGQIELYCHIPVMRHVVETLQVRRMAVCIRG